MRIGIFFTITALAVGLGPATAQTDQAEQDRKFLSEIRSLALRGSALDDIQDRLSERFQKFDVDGIPGVSAADHEANRQATIARLRAQNLTRWLIYDLDGDFQISEAELRANALPRATQPLRNRDAQVTPTPEQIDQIVGDIIAEQLELDRDGDRTLSLEELSLHAGETAERQVAGRGPNLNLPATADANGDGTVTTAEYRAEVARAFAALDTDGDGSVARSEALTSDARSNAAIRRYLESAGLSGAPVPPQREFSGARAGCVLPALPDGAEPYFIGAYDGTALTDIHLGDPTQPAELLDVTIPAGTDPIYLITTFYGDTILRLQGAADRVATVVSTGPRIGIVGGGAITFSTAPAACHIQVWRGVTPEHPDPAPFFAERLGQQLAGSVTGETLASVNLGAGTTRATVRLPGAAPTVTSGDSAEAWRRFAIFNPGGLVPLDPAAVQTAGQATKLSPRPQLAGIAQLVAEGVLVRIPQKNSSATVLEDDAGAIKIGGKTFIPGFGDDAIRMNGLTYIEERPKTWVGRASEVYLVTRPFTYPAGLSGAHAVVFLVPEGMAEPRGDKGHTRIHRITR